MADNLHDEWKLFIELDVTDKAKVKGWAGILLLIPENRFLQLFLTEVIF